MSEIKVPAGLPAGAGPRPGPRPSASRCALRGEGAAELCGAPYKALNPSWGPCFTCHHTGGVKISTYELGGGINIHTVAFGLKHEDNFAGRILSLKSGTGFPHLRDSFGQGAGGWPAPHLLVHGFWQGREGTDSSPTARAAAARIPLLAVHSTVAPFPDDVPPPQFHQESPHLVGLLKPLNLQL